MKFLILFLLVSTSLKAGPDLSKLYGHEKGNGGDGVVISDDVFLLDFYEAGLQEDKNIYFKDQDDFSPELSKKIQSYLNVDEKVANLVAAKMAELSVLDLRFEFFFKHILFTLDWVIGDFHLTDLFDHDILILEKSNKNLALVQLAIRKNNRVQIAKPYWDKLSQKHKVGLIFHEVIYAFLEADHRGLGNEEIPRNIGDFARSFTGSLFKPSFSLITQREFLTKAKMSTFRLLSKSSYSKSNTHGNTFDPFHEGLFYTIEYRPEYIQLSIDSFGIAFLCEGAAKLMSFDPNYYDVVPAQTYSLKISMDKRGKYTWDKNKNKYTRKFVNDTSLKLTINETIDRELGQYFIPSLMGDTDLYSDSQSPLTHDNSTSDRHVFDAQLEWYKKNLVMLTNPSQPIYTSWGKLSLYNPYGALVPVHQVGQVSK